MLSYKTWKTLNESLDGWQALGIRTPGTVAVTGLAAPSAEEAVLDEAKKKKKMLDKPGELVGAAEPKDKVPAKEEPEEEPAEKDEEPAEEPDGDEEGEEEGDGDGDEPAEKPEAEPDGDEEEDDSQDAGKADEISMMKKGKKGDKKADKKGDKKDDAKCCEKCGKKPCKCGKKGDKKEKLTAEEEAWWTSLNSQMSLNSKGWDGWTPVEQPAEGESELVQGE